MRSRIWLRPATARGGDGNLSSLSSPEPFDAKDVLVEEDENSSLSLSLHLFASFT